MEKTRLTQRMWAKVSAFILLIILIAITVLGVIGAAVMIDLGIYHTTKAQFRDDILYDNNASALDAFYYYHYRNDNSIENYADNYGIGYIKLYNNTTDEMIYEYGEYDENSRNDFRIFVTDEDDVRNGKYKKGDEITAYISYADEFISDTMLYYADIAIDLAYALKFWIYPIIFATTVLSVVLFIFLMCSSGYRVGYEGVKKGWGTVIPFDLLLSCWILVSLALISLATDLSYNFIIDTVSIALSITASVVSFIGLCMSFALRVKLGGWWKNTVIYYIGVLIIKMLRAIGRGLVMLGKLILNIPLIWKSALVIIALTCIEFLFFALNLYEGDNLLIFWIIEKLILVPALFYIALCLKKLQDGGREIAEGKLGYHFDTKYMIGDFKAHGENLNKIRDGINIAVDERIKSERMKTELITNVSHDIKTPLTSIINYSDLIAKEPTDNEKIAEYSVVLLRQSERLKRLIDDLVEASKASTGNLEIIPAPFDLGVLFTQTAGEYEARLAERELTLVTKQPEETLHIMADGRRMWRIFDNLMNNVCKYAQSGTRVYLTLEQSGNNAVISFKNTSREELNMSADELMERFTRGDSSRNTEGNGLGLSIAKSLAELQNGTLDLTVDGDLFKVVLKFPTI